MTRYRTEATHHFTKENSKVVRILRATANRMTLLASLQQLTLQEYLENTLAAHWETEKKDLTEKMNRLVNNLEE